MSELNETERLIVIGRDDYSGYRSMLHDNHIFVFNTFFSQQINFNIQPTIFLQRTHRIQPYENKDNFIQILHSGNNEADHWICVYYENNNLHVYDSLNTIMNISFICPICYLSLDI